VLLGRIPSDAHLEDPGSVETDTLLIDPAGITLSPGAPVLVDHDEAQEIGRVEGLREAADIDGRWLAAECLLTNPPSWLVRAGAGASFEMYIKSAVPFGAGRVVLRGHISEVTIARALRPADRAARVSWISDCQPVAARRTPNDAPGAVVDDSPGKVITRHGIGRVVSVSHRGATTYFEE
jgi:hypothetical protein